MMREAANGKGGGGRAARCVWAGRNLASQGECAVLAGRPPPRGEALHVLHLR